MILVIPLTISRQYSLSVIMRVVTIRSIDVGLLCADGTSLPVRPCSQSNGYECGDIPARNVLLKELISTGRQDRFPHPCPVRPGNIAGPQEPNETAQNVKAAQSIFRSYRRAPEGCRIAGNRVVVPLARCPRIARRGMHSGLPPHGEQRGGFI